jgi:hypothetical protein
MTVFIEHFDTARDYTLQFTITHTLVSTVTSLLPLLGSGFQQRPFFLWVPELSSASSSNFQQQLLTAAEPQQFSNCNC